MTQFVWFYVKGPDNGLELKLSIQSVLKNSPDSPSITVIGEKPSWYCGHFIECNQFTGIRDSGPRMPFRDTQHKIMVLADHPEISEEFVWIMDDSYMLKPTSVDEIRVFHYDPWYRDKTRKEWHRLIKETFAALKANGKSTLQAGTHLPHVYEKSKLKEIFDVYGFPKKMLLHEILYENHWQNAEQAVPYGGNWKGVQYPQFLKRLLKPITKQQMDEIDANFLNYQSSVWQGVARDWLTSRFAEG